MATAKEIIDDIFGDGDPLSKSYYDEWKQLISDSESLKKRSERNLQVTRKMIGNDNSQLYWDSRLLEGIAYDFNEVMSRVVIRQEANRKQVDDIFGALTIAIGMVESDNDAIEAAVAIGVVSGFVAIPFLLYQAAAIRLEVRLKELDAELKKAKQQSSESEFKLAVDISSTAVLLLFPGIGLLGRGGLFLGKWLLNEATGTPTTPGASAGTKISMTAGDFAGALEKVENIGSTTKTLARKAGGVATVAGFYFDANEIATSYRNIEKLQSALDAAQRAYKEIRDLITKHKPALEKFMRDYKRWQVAIQSIRENATAARDELRSYLRDTGYKPSQ